MSGIISWVVEQAFKKGTSHLGPVVGPMVLIGEASIKFIDKTFSEDVLTCLKTARDRNGGCQHILMAWAAQPDFGDKIIPVANNGDTKKTMAVGKRFKYTDMTYLYWHPSIKFLPDVESLVSEVYLGSAELIPGRSSTPSIGPAPTRGKASCPFCAKEIQKAMEEVNKYLEWDRNQR